MAALIIEDGTIVAGANSFTTDAEFSAYALARGYVLPATEDERNILQIKAVDYIFSVEDKLKGCRVSIDQELSYPRRGVCLYDFPLPSDSIPQALKNAQMELGAQVNVSDILISGENKNIESEKLDVLEVSYFNGGNWVNVRTDKADAYLKPLYSLGGNNETSRV